ncbi:MAG TPA: peptidoglycan DD-metalloendopeptidase family protein [Burkholderiales bacterium]|nr:peptidoglycan DD-metalloendopeptidase family protein [Burkholderiales bacterium]
MIRFLLLVAALTACACAEGAQAAASANSAKEELRELKDRIQAVQKRISEAEESKNEVSDALKASERAISDANRSLADLGERSRSANSTLTRLNADIERAERDVRNHQASLGKLVYQRYVAGRPETLAVLLNGGDPNAVARRLHYLTYVARARGEAIARVRADVDRLQKLSEEARAQATELAAITAEQAAQRTKLEQEKRSRSQVLARISRDIAKQRREVGSLKRDETRLTRLIDQLARELARQEAAARARKAKPPREARAPAEAKGPSRRETPSTARVKVDRVPETGENEGRFAQLKGKLALPVRGELANRYGSPRQDGGVVWKGLFIAARPGEEVRAIAAGRVVFADWLRGFGNLLIIDHGDSYLSLYGYNETLYKQVGDTIRGGERVAAVGNTGGHPESGLYFEMRHEGRPFDPMTWVSVR